jgi:hypothetical protein
MSLLIGLNQEKERILTAVGAVITEAGYGCFTYLLRDPELLATFSRHRLLSVEEAIAFLTPLLHLHPTTIFSSKQLHTLFHLLKHYQSLSKYIAA